MIVTKTQWYKTDRLKSNGGWNNFIWLNLFKKEITYYSFILLYFYYSFCLVDSALFISFSIYTLKPKHQIYFKRNIKEAPKRNKRQLNTTKLLFLQRQKNRQWSWLAKSHFTCYMFMPKSRIYIFIINNVLSVFHYFTFALTLQRTVAGDQGQPRLLRTCAVKLWSHCFWNSCFRDQVCNQDHKT